MHHTGRICKGVCEGCKVELGETSPFIGLEANCCNCVMCRNRLDKKVKFWSVHDGKRHPLCYEALTCSSDETLRNLNLYVGNRKAKLLIRFSADMRGFCLNRDTGECCDGVCGATLHFVTDTGIIVIRMGGPCSQIRDIANYDVSVDEWRGALAVAQADGVDLSY